MATSFVFIVDWKAGRCNNVVEVRLLRFSEACNDKVDKPPKQSIYWVVSYRCSSLQVVYPPTAQFLCKQKQIDIMCSRPRPHRLFHSQLCYLEENCLVFQLDRFMLLSSKEFEANSYLSVALSCWIRLPANEFYNSLQTPTLGTLSGSKICFKSAQNQDVAVMVNASEVTKAETLIIRDIFAFLKPEPAQLVDVSKIWERECKRIWCTYYISNMKNSIVARHVLGENTFSDKRMLSERRAALGLPVRDPQESDPTRQQPSNPTNYFEDM
ncbi:hypothetical protein DY000_02013907 [Brassica cretica]|uniref:DUF4283 domain-containing protein n=1 Tax=Brassica cretica TaxID=69181 RepID=A0ABQ7D1L1_BRACR|nr:hypothetical protein DY000_02013907 [Brassica cretica]